MLILGLDPGSRHTGYGLIETHGDRLRAVAHGRISCKSSQAIEKRLHHIAQQVEALLTQWQPEAVVIESLFHGVNSRSLIVLAQARGALLACLGAADFVVNEYSPAEIKSAVTGNGRADKTQVQRMVSMMLSVPLTDLNADSADALAAAICYSNRMGIERLTERLESGR
jgi:crossover junction endodeoxyribonuclease RuvC